MKAEHIHLLRHGEAKGGAALRGSQDDPLTDLGWRQLREAVDGMSFDAVVTSPLRRCAEFALELSLQLAVPLHKEARLREIHFGEWEGRSYAELMADDPAAVSRFYSDPFNHPPPGSESLLDFQARVVPALEDLCFGLYGRSPLVITHGGVIRLLLCHLRQWPLDRLLSIEVPLASLHRLEESDIGCWREVLA